MVRQKTSPTGRSWGGTQRFGSNVKGKIQVTFDRKGKAGGPKKSSRSKPRKAKAAVVRQAPKFLDCLAYTPKSKSGQDDRPSGGQAAFANCVKK